NKLVPFKFRANDDLNLQLRNSRDVINASELLGQREAVILQIGEQLFRFSNSQERQSNILIGLMSTPDFFVKSS
ncbi:MAG: hypothetical protein IJR98_05720, partial [Synergistaceae bacterium]|nr:hypothetical protein [Synergistaceae bacterium]